MGRRSFDEELQNFFYRRLEEPKPRCSQIRALDTSFIKMLHHVRDLLGQEKFSEFESAMGQVQAEDEMLAYRKGFADAYRLLTTMLREG